MKETLELGEYSFEKPRMYLLMSYMVLEWPKNFGIKNYTL